MDHGMILERLVNDSNKLSIKRSTFNPKVHIILDLVFVYMVSDNLSFYSPILLSSLTISIK